MLDDKVALVVLVEVPSDLAGETTIRSFFDRRSSRHYTLPELRRQEGLTGVRALGYNLLAECVELVSRKMHHDALG